MNPGFVYIMSNPGRTTFYIGVTNNLLRRVKEHKSKKIEGFASKYNCVDIVYYESFEQISSAIEREKQLKTWKRQWKIALIEKVNPEMRDLYEDILCGS
ncbi:GIY-YIG nuclease family protein [Kosmotoga olearia]|uniref:Excinuclease ABC C subunit domain protein n=1 Tax=Kosmotoga olearia (strain ATCC BAA-1733 / DSM 21960 / TBF 19.5.1) TaxID=521045 RepID=C5CID1_KOSOT|nr:GIY-YIG nuclease family protein [Kosmotoga olearia]ACR78865.1 Excinuclease ABC C subunit domain protein [Kosmotoga olearia TBF 19.5.1]